MGKPTCPRRRKAKTSTILLTLHIPPTEHTQVAAIDQDHAAGKERAAASRDQALAKIFLEAKESGRGPEWVAQQMRKKQNVGVAQALFCQVFEFYPNVG